MRGGEEHRSELDWLLDFGNDQVRDKDCCFFLLICRRRSDTKWRLHSLANMVRLWATQSVDFTFKTFESRLTQLRTCGTNGSEERSVATKLSFFANPRCQVFIWNSHSRRAIDRRYPWLQNPRRTGYEDDDLPKFFENAPRFLWDELARDDFRDRLVQLMPLIQPLNGRMFEGEADLRTFAAPRLPDKLMSLRRPTVA